ncbi:helix-turn-helix transcriptional regulator [Myxococcaceae bacterium GXIMD 01537]
MELAYGAVIAALERRLASAGARPESAGAPPVPGRGAAGHKRELLADAVARFGLPFVEELGRGLAQESGHPFIHALRTQPTPSALLALWTRLETLAHSENRVSIAEVEERRAVLLRTRASGGAPTLAEDALVMGLLSGLLEAIGAIEVHAEAKESGASGRHWTLHWARMGAPPSHTPPEPWGLQPRDFARDFARAAFALVVAEPALSLTAVSRRLGASPRNLQRRLSEVGTSFRGLVRTARVALAGQELAQHDEQAALSLATVAYACGFADSAHLSREFRALVGVQPSVFARALRAP